MVTPRLFILLLVSAFSINSYSQEIVYETEVKLQKLFSEKRESYPYVHQDINQLSLFFMDNEDIYGFTFDENFNVKADHSVSRPEGKSTSLIGGAYKDGKYFLVFSNGKSDQFAVQSIDLVNHTNEFFDNILSLGEEKYLESVNYQNKLYIFTITKASSIINVYAIEGREQKKIGVVDLSRYLFTTIPGFRLYDVMLESAMVIPRGFKLKKIDGNSPNSIELTSNEFKLYQYDEFVHITLDDISDNTKLISINLETLDFQMKYLQNLKLECNPTGKSKTNSYLGDNVLFQISVCNKCMAMTVVDPQKGTVLKKYSFNSDEEIPFKNTDVVQEGGLTYFSVNATKELDKSSIILKRINDGEIGISAYQNDNRLELTLGGITEVKTQGGSTFAPGTISHDTPGGTVTSSYNSTMNSYKSYSWSRSVYFKSILNKESYEHESGTVEDNAFDKIKKFMGDDEKKYISQTIFQKNGLFFLGYYSKVENKYYLRKFTD